MNITGHASKPNLKSLPSPILPSTELSTAHGLASDADSSDSGLYVSRVFWIGMAGCNDEL